MRTILQAIKAKLAASGSTVADGLGGKGLTVSEAIDALELDGGITPTGMLTITENTGDDGIDISQYAYVDVRVNPYLITCDANNGVDDDTYIATTRNEVTQLPDGTGLTAPSGKTFAGWSLDSAGQQPIDSGTIQVTEDTTVYAVWSS